MPEILLSSVSSIDAARLARLRAVVMDVDGVLTDGSFWWDGQGGEWKRFGFADVMGITLAKKAGLVIGLISGEDSVLVESYAKKMGIDDVHKGCKDKGAALTEIMQRHGLERDAVCFVGDDVNDLSAFKVAGLGVAPANANVRVLAQADLVLQQRGGDGAVRELLDLILASR